jgi:hypothetical protein
MLPLPLPLSANRGIEAMPLSIVILAAGQGKRMKSDLPKVLQPLAGKPLLSHVLDTAKALKADAIHVVYGHGGEQVRQVLASEPVSRGIPSPVILTDGCPVRGSCANVNGLLARASSSAATVQGDDIVAPA